MVNQMCVITPAPVTSSSGAALPFLRISSLGQAAMIVAALCLLLNILVMTIQWKLSLAKMAFAAITAPLEAPAERKGGEVAP